MPDVTVKIVSSGDEQSTYYQVAEDLAWEAAVSAASHEEIELGSDDFVEAFTYLKEKYAECANSYGHLHYIATRTLQTLVDVGMNIKYPDDECMCVNHLANHLDRLAAVIMSANTSTYSVGPTGWLSNDEWGNIPEKERTTTFKLRIPTIPQEGENEITHD